MIEQRLVIETLDILLVCPNCGTRTIIHTDQGNDYSYTKCPKCLMQFRTDWNLLLQTRSTVLTENKSIKPYKMEADIKSIGRIEYDMEDERDD